MGKFGGTYERENARIIQYREGSQHGSSSPFAFSDAVFPESDPRFEQLKQRRLENIHESISYRGVVLDCLTPNFHWVVAHFADRRDIPACLHGSYTNRERILRAIDDYLQKESERT